MGGDQKEACEAESSIGDESSDSTGSTTSSELVEDAPSSSLSLTCSTSSFSSGSDHSTSLLENGDGPLYGLSKLMVHLPIKRGLSEFYEGKSQSFTSLASVRSIEDLAKGENWNRKRLKLCKSFVENSHRQPKSPLSTISKDASKVVMSQFFVSSKPKKARSLHHSRN